jgi:hypothetical protein
MMPTDKKLYSSRADGDLYVLFAESTAEADREMDQVVKQQGMLSHTPCELVPSTEVDGRTIWHPPA